MKIDTDAIAERAFTHMESENDLNWSVAAALYELHPEWMNVVSEKLSAMWANNHEGKAND